MSNNFTMSDFRYFYEKLDENIDTALAGKADKSTTYTKNEVDAALSGKQTTLTTAQQVAVDSGITAAKVQQYDKDSAALIQQVDGGAKNLLPNSSASTTQGETTFTVNDDGSVTVVVSSPVDAMVRYVRVAVNLTLAAGTYVLSGCPAGGSSSSYNLYIENNVEDNGTGASFTLNEKTILQYVTIALRRNTPAGTYVFKPMICTAEDWAVSHKFVPHAMSNRALTEKTELVDITSQINMETSFTLDSRSRLYKQGNHIFGNLIIYREGDNIPTGQIVCCTLPYPPTISYTGGAFISSDSYNVTALGYVFIMSSYSTAGQLTIRSSASGAGNYIFIQLDYVC